MQIRLNAVFVALLSASLTGLFSGAAAARTAYVEKFRANDGDCIYIADRFGGASKINDNVIVGCNGTGVRLEPDPG